MFPVRIASLLLAIFCLAGLCVPALAAQVDCDSIYCFGSEDFGEESLTGVCITALPDPSAGTMMLGSRVICRGDILTADQLSQMTFHPLRTQEDAQATVTFLPIYADRVERSAVTTLSIRGKEDKAPVAQDDALETYKNLPNQGKLKVSDPEGEALTYSLIRKPKRGEVTITEDGSYTYTPKKNKVGVDSFTYTATDPAGNVSREATVTVQILKPTDSRQYTDTMGLDCRFAAEWMRNTGLFTGERIGQQECFSPEKAVSRGEFLAMLMQALEVNTDYVSYAKVGKDTPAWLKPYVAAALRSGITAGTPEEMTQQTQAPITGAEAAVMLQNALDLTVSQEALESIQTAAQEDAEDVPTWAAISLTTMAENGIALEASRELTRADVAVLMYQVSRLARTAPGAAVLRMHN